MTCTIRPAQLSDLELILELIQDLAEYEKLAHECVATKDALEATLFGDEPAAQVVIAEWEGRPAGFALFFKSYSTFLARPGIWLEDLFVRPDFRGKGIGKSLLIHLADVAVSSGCGRLEWAVLDWNESAIGFYRGLGAEPMGDWTTFRVVGSALNELATVGG